MHTVGKHHVAVGIAIKTGLNNGWRSRSKCSKAYLRERTSTAIRRHKMADLYLHRLVSNHRIVGYEAAIQQPDGTIKWMYRRCHPRRGELPGLFDWSFEGLSHDTKNIAAGVIDGKFRDQKLQIYEGDILQCYPSTRDEGLYVVTSYEYADGIDSRRGLKFGKYEFTPCTLVGNIYNNLDFYNSKCRKKERINPYVQVQK